MPRFKGIVRNITLSKEDMKKLLSMPLDKIDKWSPIKVVVLSKWEDVSRTLAKAMIDKIKENNAAGKPSTFIIPAGSYARPPLMYPYVVEMSVKEKISWKNVWTFNMDEVLDWTNRLVPETHPWSFYGSTKKAFFDKVDIPIDHIWFPDPKDPDAIGKKITEITVGEGVDISFDGIGEHGHLAYEEAPDLMTHWTHITPEEFKNAPTRILPHLNPETYIRALRGDWDPPQEPLYTLAPSGAITIGMKWILGAKKLMLSGEGAVFKIATMHPPTMDFPVTLVQEHTNPKDTVALLTAREEGTAW